MRELSVLDFGVGHVVLGREVRGILLALVGMGGCIGTLGLTKRAREILRGEESSSVAAVPYPWSG